jgi:hypothetical protein
MSVAPVPGGGPDVCQCDSKEFYCEIHVECDARCQALLAPQTLDDLRAAYLHWKDHAHVGGCAHGR